jgi:D-alanyl-D-alanine carboxypeptidase
MNITGAFRPKPVDDKPDLSNLIAKYERPVLTFPDGTVEQVDASAPTGGGQMGGAAPKSGGSGRLAWGGYQNGRIPKSAMKAVKVGGSTHHFEPSAAAGLQRMVADAAKDGVTIRLTDSYRSYDAQVDVRKRKGHKVATAEPGTSVHGWGRAIDVAGDAARRWIQQNGSRYGWHWPSWAQRKGTKSYEPWHFEHYGSN